jgi:hypothetical protein
MMNHNNLPNRITEYLANGGLFNPEHMNHEEVRNLLIEIREYLMKPKTFTYNEIIKFFLTNNLPLSDKQIHLIGTKVKGELAALEIYYENQKKKREAKMLKVIKRKESRQNK